MTLDVFFIHCEYILIAMYVIVSFKLKNYVNIARILQLHQIIVIIIILIYSKDTTTASNHCYYYYINIQQGYYNSIKSLLLLLY